jgi:hypothetical protein
MLVNGGGAAAAAGVGVVGQLPAEVGGGAMADVEEVLDGIAAELAAQPGGCTGGCCCMYLWHSPLMTTIQACTNKHPEHNPPQPTQTAHLPPPKKRRPDRPGPQAHASVRRPRRHRGGRSPPRAAAVRGGGRGRGRGRHVPAGGRVRGGGAGARGGAGAGGGAAAAGWCLICLVHAGFATFRAD